MFEDLKGALLVSLHGYRRSGHRIIYYEVDDKGLPILSNAPNDVYFNLDKEEITDSNKLNPYESVKYSSYIEKIDRAAQHKELLKGWFSYPPYRPASPVAMTIDDQGAIWFADDDGFRSKEKGIFVIAKFDGISRSLDDSIAANIVTYDWNEFSMQIMEHDKNLSLRFKNLWNNYLTQYCAGCHITGELIAMIRTLKI
ncbi:MAG: hypothetical protein R3B45_01135 [Bdellovibrionota bacterium]